MAFFFFRLICFAVGKSDKTALDGRRVLQSVNQRKRWSLRSSTRTPPHARPSTTLPTITSSSRAISPSRSRSGLSRWSPSGRGPAPTCAPWRPAGRCGRTTTTRRRDGLASASMHAGTPCGPWAPGPASRSSPCSCRGRRRPPRPSARMIAPTSRSCSSGGGARRASAGTTDSPWLVAVASSCPRRCRPATAMRECVMWAPSRSCPAVWRRCV